MNLNFLYCSDNNYAPFLGISILSLLKHNTSAERVRIYVVADAISQENLDRLTRTVEAFGKGRELILVDGKEYVERLYEMGIYTYRGGQTTNLRLFFTQYIDEDVERLLYLDCDTLICDDLTDLFATDMGTSCIAGVKDSLSGEYKELLGFAADETYFNAGVALFDVKNWVAGNSGEKMAALMRDPMCKGANNDQDYLNFFAKGNLTVLSPRYNFQTTHQICSEKTYFSCYPRENYYTDEEIAFARSNPAILHTYRFLGQFPWHKRNVQPAKKLFWDYVKESEWSDLKPLKNKGKLFAFERFVYRLCPKKWFWKFFSKMQRKMFCDLLKKRRAAEEGK